MLYESSTTDQALAFTFDSDSLAYQVSYHGKAWHSFPGFRPYFEYLPLTERGSGAIQSPDNMTFISFTGARIYFDQAVEIGHRPISTGVGRGVCSTFRKFRSGQNPVSFEFETRCWLENANSSLHMELIPLVDDPGLLRIVWPAPFELPELNPQCYTVLPMMQGCLIPNNWPEKLSTFGSGFYYSRAAYMPWWGQVEHGAGNIAIVDTPWDAGYLLDHPAGGPTLLQPVWYPSLREVRYARRMQYRFIQNGDYNDLCKLYRQYALQQGGLRTLAEKAAAHPALNQLIGSPVVHTSIYTHIQPASHYYQPDDPAANDVVVTFAERACQLEALKQRGVERAYVHLDGWGKRGYDNLHPDVLPPCEQAGGWDGMRHLSETCQQLGFLLATHDQYRDYYKDADSYDPEMAVHDERGSIPGVAIWYGGDQAFLCAQLALEYVRRNYSLFDGAGVHLDGAYLDVFAVVDLDECYHPEHLMSRKECLEARAACFAYMSSRDMLVSSEESIGWAVPYLDLVHHGPFALADDYDRGPGRGIPVPLFNLVYHDCLILPWSLTTGGWGIPQADSGLLHAYLNGGTGYLSIEAEAEEIEKVKALCAFQSKVAHAELVRHEFIDGNLRRQRAVYSNGISVEVDFDLQTVNIHE